MASDLLAVRFWVTPEGTLTLAECGQCVNNLPWVVKLEGNTRLDLNFLISQCSSGFGGGFPWKTPKGSTREMKGWSSQSEVCRDPHNCPCENNLFTAWLPAETSPTSTTRTTATATSSTGGWRRSPSSPPIRGQSLVGTWGSGESQGPTALGGRSQGLAGLQLEVGGGFCRAEVDSVPRKGESASESCTAAVMIRASCSSGDRGKTILRLALLIQAELMWVSMPSPLPKAGHI